MTQAACLECKTIAQEIRAAYLEMCAGADQEFHEAWQAIREMQGEAPSRYYPRIGSGIRRKLVHEAFTGHRVPAHHRSE